MALGVALLADARDCATTVAADEELLADCADALMLVMLAHVRILRCWLTLLMLLLLLPLRMCGARECCGCW